ncbi:hypothetical protein [Pedobacter endophyticus]|uniref:Uncharacterized protein n=1 Tax=Pedobacter endophyticus TaxID=2789740 RepID=A0A7U3Q4W3_9SPHI|nr:hypothetical protein [Pedobacter endophyticus]QPH37715.1 hypothetical protein IZT61_11375 [Pedobacter endophyticus]
MKTISTIILCLVLGFAKAQLPSDTLVHLISFENLQGYKDGYGESTNQPLSSGAFINIADRNARQNRMAKLRNSFRWPDGTVIDFSKRGSKMGKTGMVDLYTLENPATKEVITLVVDPYKSDSVYYVPKGLIAVNKEIVAKEIAPFLKKIEVINSSGDAYTEQKDNIAAVTGYLAANVGVAGFLDRENLTKLMTDTQADAKLKNYLFGVYIINKFYALGKGIAQPKAYALKKMKESFVAFEKAHPDVEAGNIKINLN